MTDRAGAADKAFDVLEALVEHDRLADIAQVTGLPKATVHRILRVMVDRGLAQPTGDGGYRCGPRMVALAGRVMRSVDLADRVAPSLAALRDRTGHTVHLALKAGDEAVYVAKLDAGKPYQLASRVGMSLHLHSTSIGKAILATLTDAEVGELAGRTGLPARTPHTITALPDLLAEIARTRRRGWAEDHEENEPGVGACGAAVRDHTGAAIGGISAVALTHDLDGGYADLGHAVIAAAHQVSRALGAQL
ncbi:IclR family transcriptional regulator [Asanoa sp. WMMD1127]|uniref:IclR family transcriptional regulator n=1 Tax=Asanoa sp. WMMD1127 TaxID=3016107 RepID=UPI002416DE1A|nr:IclR family transcriptional regulator [Asanoa sp. WMMD1127]MDG4822987.1 IclR family transcriptional regulator [Asanoa sp. WMMD1127]